MRRENANSKLVASAGGEEKGRGSAGRQLLEGTAQAIGYFDRLDYVSPMNREHAFVLAAEKLLGIEVPRKRTYTAAPPVMACVIADHYLRQCGQVGDSPAWPFAPPAR